MSGKDVGGIFGAGTAFHRGFREVAQDAYRCHDHRERDRPFVRKFRKEPECGESRETSCRDEPTDQAFDRLSGRDLRNEFVFAKSLACKVRSGVSTHNNEEEVAEKMC